MGKKDPRVDAYIAKSADFAQPILKTIRAAVHTSCPDVVEEIKWGFPHFTYKGMLCAMAAFKQHAALGFWKGSLVLGRETGADAMGHFGRLTKVSDLPPKKVLAGYIKKAMALNDQGVKVPRPLKRATPKPLIIPPELTAALKKNAKARTGFDAMPPSHKREYADWISAGPPRPRVRRTAGDRVMAAGSRELAPRAGRLRLREGLGVHRPPRASACSGATLPRRLSAQTPAQTDRGARSSARTR